MKKPPIEARYSSEAVANFFIKKSADDNIQDLTPMKLQKLVYIGLGWVLALGNLDIIGGEQVQAWKHGPVIPSLYHELKNNGHLPVTELIVSAFSALDDDGEPLGPPVPDEIPESDTATRGVLEAVWDVYKTRTGAQLRDITHRHDTPWRMHYVEGQRNIEIPKQTIRDFYSALKAKSEIDA